MSGDDDKRKGYDAASMQYAMQAYQERYTTLSNEVNRLVQEIAALGEVRRALADSGKVSERETLVSCGMGFFVPGKTGRMDRVAVDVGAGVIVEKSVAEAAEMADRRIEARNSALKRMLSERKELEGAIYDLSYKLQSSMG